MSVLVLMPDSGETTSFAVQGQTVLAKDIAISLIRVITVLLDVMIKPYTIVIVTFHVHHLQHHLQQQNQQWLPRRQKKMQTQKIAERCKNMKLGCTFFFG